MPGAPNRPPETPAPPPPPSGSPDESARQVLRRLAPARVALRLDVWKGAPHADLLTPYGRAETLFEKADYPGAISALDQLSVRFAEPRWPTMPVPFRDLRVTIAAPQPPQWDPEFALTLEERDARRQRRVAELQLTLAQASVEWGRAHAVACEELLPRVEQARAVLGDAGPTADFWAEIDQVWATVHDRFPAPGGAPPRAAPVPAPADAERAEAA